MYGKLIDGKLIKAKHFIKTDKETIINPTNETYVECGYKIIEEDKMPELNENQVLKITYEETDCKILKHYNVEEAETEYE